MACLALTPHSAAAADGQTYLMKLSTATLNDAQHEWMKRFAAMVEKDSGGRIKAQIYPASQLGSIPRQIEGTQFGAIQGWVGPPEFLIGVDERFEIMTAPGLFENPDHAIRTANDPELRKMILGFGANKGLTGISLFISAPTSIVTRKPVRDLAGFKGLKLRTLASKFENEQVYRLGATPVAMSLGDVLPALQQGAVDGAVAQVAIFTTMHYYDAAKYITETNQRYIFSVAEMSQKWLATLPPDLQKIIRDDGAKLGPEISPWAVAFYQQQRKVWVDKGGQLISLPPAEEAAMMKSLSNIGNDLTKSKPALHAAYETLVAAAKRTQ
ncbi:MAG TPA: TRAP transporter substrate-binding protein [Stellaceae bacterium]|nr:TRAP transporter substrate-binding protein [Stellaceae bacterium]